MIRSYKHSRVFMSGFIALTLILVGCSTAAEPSTNATLATTENSTATQETSTEATSEAAIETTENASNLQVECTKLNLNTLTEDELMTTIPNFSARMVREFFEYRPYVSIQQFRREIGKYVDDAQVAEYEQYVFVPIDPNNADADTLMQISGVDEAFAQTLSANRPYDTNEAFLDTLSETLTPDQVNQAACYLDTDV